MTFDLPASKCTSQRIQCRIALARLTEVVNIRRLADGLWRAADDWDAPRKEKRVLQSRSDSYERACHDSGVARFLLDLAPGKHEALRRRLSRPRLERFIGVIYRHETARWSHYSEAVLPDQFDAYAWFDETRALEPLAHHEPHGGVPETYPFGL